MSPSWINREFQCEYLEKHTSKRKQLGIKIKKNLAPVTDVNKLQVCCAFRCAFLVNQVAVLFYGWVTKVSASSRQKKKNVWISISYYIYYIAAKDWLLLDFCFCYAMLNFDSCTFKEWLDTFSGFIFGIMEQLLALLSTYKWFWNYRTLSSVGMSHKWLGPFGKKEMFWFNQNQSRIIGYCCSETPSLAPRTQ